MQILKVPTAVGSLVSCCSLRITGMFPVKVHSTLESQTVYYTVSFQVDIYISLREFCYPFVPLLHLYLQDPKRVCVCVGNFLLSTKNTQVGAKKTPKVLPVRRETALQLFPHVCVKAGPASGGKQDAGMRNKSFISEKRLWCGSARIHSWTVCKSGAEREETLTGIVSVLSLSRRHVPWHCVSREGCGTSTDPNELER